MGAQAGPALWFAFRGERLLVEVVGGEDPPAVPRVTSLEELGLSPAFRHEVGFLNGERCWAAGLEPDAEPPEGLTFRDLRGLWSVDERFFVTAGRAKQIVEWDRTHRFCGRDGAETVPGPTPLSKECPRCGLLFYPRLSPAVIVLVKRGNEALLARSPGFPPGMYSVLAGFVEPGESIEETIEREVREEVGIEVKNVRYFGSQPWPFPNSLMLGFTVDYAGGELRADPAEIEEAGWYTVDDLPPLPPKLSIARRMIDEFAARYEDSLEEAPETPG